MGVNLHVDLETLQLIQGPGQRSAVNTLRFKRGDDARLQVAFLLNGITPVTIGDPGTLEIQIGIKPRNQFDRSYLAHTADWSMPSEGDDTPKYECALGFNTLQLNSALNIGSPTAEELPEITLMGEITWREGAGEPISTRTFLVVVENDVNRGTEGVPTNADPAYPAATSIELVSRKGAAYGYAELDSSGTLPVGQLPQLVELTSRKGMPHGYAELDAHGFVPATRLPALQAIHGIQVTTHGVAVGNNTIAHGSATLIGALATGYGVSVGFGSVSHGEAVAIGNNTMAYSHGIALGFGARTEGLNCIAIGNGVVTGDTNTMHGYGRLEVAPYGSTGPRLSGHVWGGANVMQFSVTDGHGLSPTALHGGAVFNHAPGTIPPGMMMFAYSAISGSLTIYVNAAGTLKTATLPMI